MDNRAQGTGLETRIYGIECGFRIKYAVTSHSSGPSVVKVGTLGIHQFKTDRMIQKLNGLCVVPEVQQYTGITISGICPILGQSKRWAPEQSLCGTSGTKKKRNPHSIKGRADIPYIRNWVACVFPIQFLMLYYPWWHANNNNAVADLKLSSDWFTIRASASVSAPSSVIPLPSRL